MKKYLSLLLIAFLLFVSSANAGTIRIYPISDNSIGADWADEADAVDIYASIDEVVLNEADYIALGYDYSGVPINQSALFNWTQIPSTGAAISEIIMYAQVIKANWGGLDVAALSFCVPDDTNGGYFTGVTLTESSALVHVHYPVDPSTGVAWTRAGVNALKAGFYGTSEGTFTAGSQPRIYWTFIDVVEAAAASTFIPQILIF